LRRSAKRGIEHVMLDTVAQAARPWRLETSEQALQGPPTAMPDQVRDVLDEYEARTKRCHEVRHCCEQPIVLIRFGHVMLAVPDLTEPLAGGAGSQ